MLNGEIYVYVLSLVARNSDLVLFQCKNEPQQLFIIYFLMLFYLCLSHLLIFCSLFVLHVVNLLSMLIVFINWFSRNSSLCQDQMPYIFWCNTMGMRRQSSNKYLHEIPCIFVSRTYLFIDLHILIYSICPIYIYILYYLSHVRFCWLWQTFTKGAPYIYIYNNDYEHPYSYCCLKIFWR